MMWEVELPWDRPPLSLNDRHNFRVKAKIVADIREVAGWKLRAAKIPHLQKVSVKLVWTVPSRVRRDTDNPTATMKPIYDALVDVGIIDDDTPEYLVKPETWIAYERGVRKMVLVIEELS